MKHEWPLLASSLVLVGLLAAGPLSAGPTPSSLAAAALAGDSIVHDDFSVTTYRPGTSAGETFVVVLDHRTETIHAYRVRPGASPELERLSVDRLSGGLCPGRWQSLIVFRLAWSVCFKGC